MTHHCPAAPLHAPGDVHLIASRMVMATLRHDQGALDAVWDDMHNIAEEGGETYGALLVRVVMSLTYFGSDAMLAWAKGDRASAQDLVLDYYNRDGGRAAEPGERE